MRKKIYIGLMILSLLFIVIIIFTNRDSIFKKTNGKTVESSERVLSDEDKAIKILSEKLGIEKDKFVYEGKTENGELIFSNKDNENNHQKSRYIIDIKTELYTVEEEITFYKE